MMNQHTRADAAPIPFIDVAAQRRRLGTAVDEATFNIDLKSAQRAIATARRLGLKPKAIMPVDLFGQPADHTALTAMAQAERLFVLDDAAQAFGATWHNRRIGALADVTATS